jgi:single-strand DNA-binding protein
MSDYIKNMAIGRLTADPELKTVKVGTDEISVCEFSIAVNRGYGDNKKTEFIDCVAWRKLGEIVAQYAKKGRQVLVVGEQQTRKFDIQKEGVSFTVKATTWQLDDCKFLDSNSNVAETSEPAETPKSFF